jgi:Dolichyl-phosphate-mannose-protein mannosyltransferase/LmeA-like phospholipid-binding
MSGRPWLAAIGPYAALCVVVTVWASIDRHPPEWDYANHLERALECQRTLANPAADRFGEIMGASAFYPPLAICTAGALYFVFPVTTLTAQAVMLLFLGIGMFSVYGIGRTVADPMAGLLAAFFLGTAPFVVYSLLNFQLDLPLMAMVALALDMLIRTERFSRPGWTAALGLVWGLGLLTKPTFPVYAFPPLLWTLGEAMWSGRRWRRLLWIGLAGAIAVVVALPWYSSRLLGMPLQFMNRSFKFAEQEGHAPTLTSVALLFYPTNFPTHFGFLAALCFLAGLLALHRFREHRAVLWIAALAPFVLITLIRNKNPRYALPALAAAAVVAALGAYALPRVLRRVAVGACVVAAALQVSMIAFGVPALPPMPGQSIRYVIEYPPSRDDWQHARILDDIARDSGGRPVRVSVVPNYDFFSVSNFRYEAKRRGLPFTVLRAWNATPLGVDYAILKSGNLGPDFSIAKARRIMRSFEQPGSALARLFPVVGQYPLPDGSRAELRVRRIHAPDGVKPEVLAARIRDLRAGLLPSLVRDAENLRIDLRYRPEALLRGEVDALTVTADAASVGELSRKDRLPLRVRDIRVTILNLVVDPVEVLERRVLEPLDVGTVSLERLVVLQSDLQRVIDDQRQFARMSVELGDGTAQARVTGLGPRAGARVRVLPGSEKIPIALDVDQLRIGWLRVPDSLVHWIARTFDPSPQLGRLPIKIQIAPVAIRPGRLEIGLAR